MGLLKKSKKEELYKDYPTKEEYLREVKRIQSEELKSDRYMQLMHF